MHLLILYVFLAPSGAKGMLFSLVLLSGPSLSGALSLPSLKLKDLKAIPSAYLKGQMEPKILVIRIMNHILSAVLVTISSRPSFKK